MSSVLLPLVSLLWKPQTSPNHQDSHPGFLLSVLCVACQGGYPGVLAPSVDKIVLALGLSGKSAMVDLRLYARACTVWSISKCVLGWYYLVLTP